MLSTENPPPDPSYLCEISQLKSSRSDEKASDINQHQFEVDLLKSGLDDNNPLPKFSIRDYVFRTRGKDIKTNWPFSTGNLQLCLKHGVSDVLPPFQSLDSVRNQLVVKRATHNTSNSDGKLSPLCDHVLSFSSDNVGRKLVVDIENINFSGSDEDKDFPSTTSQSYSDINQISPLRGINLVPEAQKLPGKSEEKIDSPVSASNKVESSDQNPVKKCRLMVKLSNIAVPKSNEDSAANTSVVSETMTSKVCPVCKTFSSSSNTTLNAHIDQCLSGESTIKWTANSKVIKHRIKPRKTRLMVDVYETALRCTLEDLDRRNGTNWASNSGFWAQEFETCAELKNEAFCSVNIENKNEEGAVYIDSNGTKLRILSKFNDLHSSSGVKGDCGPKNLLKNDKGSKFLACKKKNDLVRKLKLLKCSYGQRRCSPRTNPCLEDGDSQIREFTPEKGCEKEDGTQTLKACDQMKYNDFGMIKRWVGSKRSGLKKKINLEHEDWYPEKIMKNLGVKSSMSSSNDRFTKRTSDLNSSILSDEDLLLPTQSSRIKENSSCKSHHEYEEPLSLKKRVGFSLLESQNCHDKRNSMALTQCKVKQPRRDGPSVHELCMNPSSMGNHVSIQSNKRMELNISPAKYVDADRRVITPRLSQQHALSSGGKCSYKRKTSLSHEFSPRGKFSSVMKNLFSPRRASVPESKKSLRRKCLDIKKRKLHYTAESDEGEQVLQSAVCKQDSFIGKLGECSIQMEKVSVKSYINRTRALKIQKTRGEIVNSCEEGAKALKNSETSSESDIPAGKNFDSFVGGNVPLVTSNVLDLDAVQETGIPEKFVYKQTSKIDGVSFMGFSKSLGSAFPVLAGPSGVECIPQQIKALEEHCPAEQILDGEQNIFYADKFGEDMVVHNADAVTGMDSIEGNYFLDVDPIPIPGPPGSFLPSPGHVGSEELQGNSSLTTCRIQSSEEVHELVDMDSSDSPISATSTISISNAVGSDSAAFEIRSNGAQPETGHHLSGAKIDPSVENSTPYETAARGDGNLKFADSRANLKFPEMGSSSFNNSQPCRCSRKEGVSINVSLNSQDSLLLQRRSVSSRPLLAVEKETGGYTKKKLNSFNLRTETLPVNEPSPGSEKSIADSPVGYGPVLVSYNSEDKFPTCGDYEFPSPSISNPVLRLMGKNLLVVNKDEDLSPQTRSTQSIMTNDYPVVQSCINAKIQSENYSPHRLLSQGPSTFDHMQSSKLAQHYTFSSSYGFSSPGNLGKPCLSSQPSTVVLPSKNFGQSLTSSLEHHKHVGGCTLAPKQLGSKIRLDTSITCDTDQKVQTSAPKLRRSDFSISNKKEIIIIDDLHESGLAVEATPGQQNMDAGNSMVGISASVVWGCESRHASPFYSFQKRGRDRSQVVPDANIFVPTLKGINANAVKWNCAAKGSSVQHSNSLTDSSSSTGHRGSVLYYPPSFS